MRTQFNKDLDQIRDSIQLLGQQANAAAARAVNALVLRNFQEAREVKRDDRSVDQLRYQVETACLTLMATQQPVARDLRELAAATFVAVELERCGDYAKGIAKAARRISRVNSDISSYNLGEMDGFARSMLEHSIRAFMSADTQLAQSVITDDHHIDKLYDDLLASVITDMTTNTTIFTESREALCLPDRAIQNVGVNLAPHVRFRAAADHVDCLAAPLDELLDVAK